MVLFDKLKEIVKLVKTFMNMAIYMKILCSFTCHFFRSLDSKLIMATQWIYKHSSLYENRFLHQILNKNSGSHFFRSFFSEKIEYFWIVLNTNTIVSQPKHGNYAIEYCITSLGEYFYCYCITSFWSITMLCSEVTGLWLMKCLLFSCLISC